MKGEIVNKADLYRILFKTSNMTPIKIKRFGDILTVYITKIQLYNKVWAIGVHENQDTLIFPSKNVEILSIGHKKIQSNSSYKEEQKDALEIKKIMESEKKKKLYNDAYHHNLKYPNID